VPKISLAEDTVTDNYLTDPVYLAEIERLQELADDLEINLIEARAIIKTLQKTIRINHGDTMDGFSSQAPTADSSNAVAASNK
jgi:hypothetical protein